VVTVIKLLSPANKTPGQDRDAFLLKRGEYLAAEVNLVEMDFLRKGIRLPWGEPVPPATDYYVLLHRAADRPRAQVWPCSVRDPMAAIPIPLNRGAADLHVSLGECLQLAYGSADYARELEYDQPPNPPLDEPDATWARQLLTAHLAARPPGEQP
jgi:hypothetical protein